LVQIFVKSIRGNNGGTDDERYETAVASSDEDESTRVQGNQGYQLLTEVKNGASMSSLFSILTLFTEDIQLRHRDVMADEYDATRVPSGAHLPESIQTSPGGLTGSPRQGYRETVDSSSQPNDCLGALPAVPPLNLEDRNHSTSRLSSHRASKYSGIRRKESVHPDIVARAMVDTTIAIIPASAFRRLTRVYPRASAHIIQVILTRLQRVTFSTAHSYLGLNTEVLSIEKQMNRFTAFDLPNDLRGIPLDRLKDKFTQERDRLGPEDDTKGIALHNPLAGRRRRSSSSLRKDAALHAKIAASRRSISISDGSDLQGISPGDLLSTIQLSRFGHHSGLR
jgi:lysophospholipid hydrolase